MKHSESVLLEFYRLLAEGAGKTIQKNSYFSCLSVPTSSYPNFLFRPVLKVDSAETIVNEIKRKIKEGFPSVMVCSLTETNEETIQLLNKYTAYGKFWTAMTFDLKELSKPEINLNLNIKLIEERLEFHEWTKIVESELTGTGLDEKIFDKMGKHNNAHFYLAYLDGFPVATSLIICKGDDVGIYLIATLKEFRKRGIGKYITEYILWQAKQNGALFAHLQATELGKTVYQKIGFEIMGRVPVFKIG